MRNLNRAIPDLPRASWARVIRRTLAITSLVLPAALASTWLTGYLEGQTMSGIEYAMAIVGTILIGIPVLGIFTMKLEELRLAYMELDHFSKHDALTGLLTRGALIDEAEKQASQLSNASDPVGCLMVIDVDHFKRVNDNYGHAEGDHALQAISNAIIRQTRDADLVGRMGGEEFGVFLTDCALDEAMVFAERMRNDVENIKFVPSKTRHPLSVSIGLSAWPAGAEFKSVFKNADKQLYAAKRGGRNRIVVMHPRAKSRRSTRKVAA